MKAVHPDKAYNLEMPIEMFAGEGDVVFAISSSGRSENIPCRVRVGISKKCRVITLSEI